MCFNFKKGTEHTHLFFTRYIPSIWMTSPNGFDIPCIYNVYHNNKTYIYYVYGYIPNVSQQPPSTFIIHKYMPCIYLVYTWHILIYTVHITFTSCFQGFVALIAHTRRPIRTPLTTCQTYTMRLILHLHVLVSSSFYKYTFQFWCICCRYTVYIQCILNVHSLECFDILPKIFWYTD